MNLPIADIPNQNTLRNGQHPPTVPTPLAQTAPDPQVAQRPTRRRLTAEYKRRILQEAQDCKQPGQIGALLRREGLYASSLHSFRQQQQSGKLGKNPQLLRQKRQEKEAQRQRDARKIALLEAENNKLKVLLELQKKVAELMQLTLCPTTS